jgi:hypothetical protein
MWEGPNLFRALDDEWRHVGTNAIARRALRRWADADDVLADLGDPGALVRRCHARDDSRAEALLAAVVRHARTDPMAARTVLQAVLPGLAAVSRRALGFVGPGRVWARVDELDQHVVAVACERIHALAPAPPRWLAKAIVDGTWQRVRWYALRQHCDSRRRTVLSEAADAAAPSPATPGAELAGVLAEAVELGVLEKLDAWVVFHSRVNGIATPTWAADAGVGSRRLWRRRERAEEQLVAAARPSDRRAWAGAE